MDHSKPDVSLAHSISVIMPAYNEARNLKNAVQSVHQAFEGIISEYEIIIVNDGSVDGTREIADQIAEKDGHVRAIHNPKNSGYGYTFLRGAAEATLEYIQLIPGDGEIPAASISTIAGMAGKADLVLPYMENFRIRSFYRKFISVGYTTLINILFGLRIKYYNGPFLLRRAIFRQIHVKATGFAFMASIVIQAIKKQKCTYTQVGIQLAPRAYGKSSLNMRKIIAVFMVIMGLFWEVQLQKGVSK